VQLPAVGCDLGLVQRPLVAAWYCSITLARIGRER
jgi:hypothetical protein